LKAIHSNPDDPLHYWVEVSKVKTGDGEADVKVVHRLTEESLYDSRRMPLGSEIKGNP
jgi:hypothetical protein